MAKKSQPPPTPSYGYNTGALPEGTPAIAASVPDDSSQPPPYSGPPASNPSRAHHIPGLPPNIPWSHYRLSPGSYADSSKRIIYITDNSVTSSLSAFLKFVNQQTALPPKQAIRIRGTHQKHISATETDFDFRIDVMRYFLPQGQGEAALNYVRVSPPSIPQGQPGAGSSSARGGHQSVQEYAKAFLMDKTLPKQFNILRLTSNWDRDYISGCIHTLLANLNYRGKISVEFPSSHSTVCINTEPKSIASTLRSLFATPKEYGIQAIWPYATFPPGGAEAETRDVPRRCLVRSEEGWWRDWRDVIRQAILEKKKDQAWVGMDDWMEVMMTPVQSEKPPRPWGMDE